ncbi:MAG: hypothetical protein HDR71_16065 [Lachnospiraceae bacterium]|nr:hypothetical protein [Lachnospiraceae bacterium]
MSKDIAIDKASAPGRMAQIQSETEGFLSEMEGGYGELLGSISRSKGDFIDALKVQINSELEMVRGTCDFFLTLLQMMQAADTDFGTLDDAYSKEKIK